MVYNFPGNETENNTAWYVYILHAPQTLIISILIKEDTVTKHVYKKHYSVMIFSTIFLYAILSSAELFCRILGVLQNSAELSILVPQTSAELIDNVLFRRTVLRNSY